MLENYPIFLSFGAKTYLTLFYNIPNTLIYSKLQNILLKGNKTIIAEICKGIDEIT